MTLLILPSEDHRESFKDGEPCKNCKGQKVILEIEDLEIVLKDPCPHCSPTPSYFRSLGFF